MVFGFSADWCNAIRDSWSKDTEASLGVPMHMRAVAICYWICSNGVLFLGCIAIPSTLTGGLIRPYSRTRKSKVYSV